MTSMQVGVGLLDAKPQAADARGHVWVLRALTFLPLHILLVGLALYVYNRTAVEWQSETTKYTFGNFPPLYATQTQRDLTATPPLLVPLAIVLTWILLIWAQLRWKVLPQWIFPMVAVAFVFAINVTTAMIDSRYAVNEPFSRRDLEYIGDVPDVQGDAVKFMRDYPALNPRLTIHAGTHPPGGVLFLYFVARWFGPETQTASCAAIAFTSLGIIPAFFLARRLFGPRGGVIAAGMYAVMPGLVLFGATSMDGAFVVFPALSVWLIHESLSRKRIIWAVMLGVLAGGALTASMFMTFATLCIGIFYVIHALLTPRKEFLRVLIVLSATLASFILCNFILYWTLGYDVIACMFAAIERDAETVGTGFESMNRYLDVSLANFVSFLFAAGIPAIALWLRSAAKNRLALSFLIAMIFISFSTLFTLETERIWIFLLPILVCVCAGWLAPRKPILAAGLIALTFLQTWLMEALLYTHW